MADVALYPRAAPRDRVRVWLGTHGRTGVPQPVWTLDGAPAAPAEVAPLASVRDGSLRAPDERRAFAGVYEFAGVAPRSSHLVEVRLGNDTAEAHVRTLPAEIPPGGWFHVLLVSCFHAAEAHRGRLKRIIRRIGKATPPDLTLLLGDQVYLDLPTLQSFRNDRRWLAREFERKYVHNWFLEKSFPRVLAAAPSVAIPDDHEYWNNYPHASPTVRLSLSKSGRKNWRKAARACFRGFQQPAPAAVGAPVVLDVPPVSFFVADTRTHRDADGDFSLRPTVRQALAAWSARIEQDGLLGILVTGQSLFSPAAGKIQGTIADRELADYDDYDEILHHLLGGRGERICVTGDVHWGRVLETRNLLGRRHVEVISSPSALVTTVGQDQIRRVSGFFRGLFGATDPWPRHNEADDPREHWPRPWRDRGYESGTWRGQRGDQVAVLSLRRAGARVECRVASWPIHPDLRDPVVLPSFFLPRRL